MSTTTDLVLRDELQEPQGIVNPATGEAVTWADATREDIAAWYVWVIDRQAELQRIVREAERAFAAKSDKETTLGVTVGRYRVSVPGAGDRFVANHEALRAALIELAEEGEITRQAADEACKPNGVTCPSCDSFIPDGSFKVSHKALTALRKVKKLETVIDACGEYVSPWRGFSVKRS